LLVKALLKRDDRQSQLLCEKVNTAKTVSIICSGSYNCYSVSNHISSTVLLCCVTFVFVS